MRGLFLYLNCLDRIAVFFDETDKVFGLKPDGGGVIARMNADDAAICQKLIVEEELDSFGVVIQETEWGDGARNEVKSIC